MSCEESNSHHSEQEEPYTRREEFLNVLTHGLGAALSIVALSLLVSFASIRGNAWHIVSFSIYGSTLVILYLASTFYHIFRSPRVKRVFHILDHVSIYLLIAGTYTPFTLVAMRGGWGWSLFGIVWGLALVGIVLKCFLTGRYDLISTLMYVVMGWIWLIGARPFLSSIPSGSLLWLFIGGAAYTLGVIFYVWETLPYNHAIWHVFVLAGSICHFFAVLLYLLPDAPPSG